MFNYTIKTEVYSPARFSNGVEIGGYLFDSVNDENGTCTVSKIIHAKNWRDALGLFNDGLWPIIDAVAFHRLSAMSSYGVSTVIVRDSDPIALAVLMKKSPGVGLSMAGIEAFQHESDEIQRLAEANDPALGHFRSSMLATGANSITFHLLQCAESLAGAKPQSFRCESCRKTLKCAECGEKSRPVMSDKQALKRILGDELYEFYYSKQGANSKSYRNMLIHGDYVDEAVLAAKVENLYEALKDNIKEKHGLQHMRSISGVRNINGYGRITVFVAFEEPLPTNAELLRQIDDREIGHATKPYRVIFEDDPEHHPTLDTF